MAKTTKTPQVAFRRRSEKSVLRPIENIELFDRLLERVTVVVADESRSVNESAVYLSPAELRSAPIAIHASLTAKSDERYTKESFENDLAKLGLDLSDVEFVVAGQTSFLKLESELFRGGFPLAGDGEFGGPVAIEIATSGRMERADVLQTVTHGFDLHVMVVLAQERQREARRAWRKGTILDRRTFRVRPYQTGEFVPNPLTAEVRDQLGIPDDTYQFIRILSSPWTVTRIDECVDAYVDADLLAFLDGNSPGQKAAQDDLARDVIREIVFDVRGSTDRPTEWDDEYSGSVLGSMLRLIDPGTKARPKYTEAELYSMITTNPARIGALIDSRTKSRKNANLRLRGDEK